jgi:hypothetical protein
MSVILSGSARLARERGSVCGRVVGPANEHGSSRPRASRDPLLSSATPATPDPMSETEAGSVCKESQSGPRGEVLIQVNSRPCPSSFSSELLGCWGAFTAVVTRSASSEAHRDLFLGRGRQDHHHAQEPCARQPRLPGRRQQDRHVDVRVVCATNGNLKTRISLLYYRLNDIWPDSALRKPDGRHPGVRITTGLRGRSQRTFWR